MKEITDSIQNPEDNHPSALLMVEDSTAVFSLTNVHDTDKNSESADYALRIATDSEEDETSVHLASDHILKASHKLSAHLHFFVEQVFTLKSWRHISRHPAGIRTFRLKR